MYKVKRASRAAAKGLGNLLASFALFLSFFLSFFFFPLSVSILLLWRLLLLLFL